jgi:predicted ATPase
VRSPWSAGNDVAMKISKLIIKGFQQFRNFHLDLADPATGEPLDKICFIGPNATGKSTLLRLIYGEILRQVDWSHGPAVLRAEESLFAKLRSAHCDFWLCGNVGHPKVVCRADFDEAEIGDRLLADPGDENAEAANLAKQPVALANYVFPVADIKRLAAETMWRNSDGDLVIYSPPDSTSLLPEGGKLPKTNLDAALGLFKDFPAFQKVNTQKAGEFWRVLIYHIKKREEDWQAYLQQPENRQKSVEEAERDFQSAHPEILGELAALWNRILAPAGLEFDYQAAKKPVQLNENLEAYVKLKSTGQPLEYNALSTGIRNFIFRLGHIHALYFGRRIERGFLLLDEPENSLYPDFLYDLIEVYQSIIRNTQFFVATHNPIIAAQFRPEERVILEFDDHGHVTPRRGVTPLGDDPNDLLQKDFVVRSLYGREGLAKWERFLHLRRLIKRTSDPAAKRALLDEYLQIGNAYNFNADAVPQEEA